VTTQVTKNDKAFFGHPAGLAWLAGSEFWERFSYYGMQTLLVLYMTGQLLHPGHVEHILGFAPFHRAIESVYGHLSTEAFASIVFGLYAGFVYLTPLLGGFIADRFLGRTRAVTFGAIVMAAGHFLMAFEASFLIALSCLLIGVGFFKGNIATQVGDLYGHDDPRRADAFQIYFLGIQIAVIGSPLICGTLGETVGWHWGFGAAGVGMLIGLTTYLLGRPNFPLERPRQTKDSAPAAEPLSGSDWGVIAILVLLTIVLAVASVGNQEIFDGYLLWAKADYDLVLFGRQMPVTWLISFDAIVSTVTMAGMVLFWRWWATRWREPDELQKIILGVAISALAPLALAGAAAVFAATGHRVSLGWGVAFELLNDIGFANVFPVGMALYTRAAPKGTAGTLMAVYLLQLFMGNMFVGYLGGLLDRMPGTSFWLLHAGLIASAAVVLVLLRMVFGRILAPSYEEPEAAAEAAA